MTNHLVGTLMFTALVISVYMSAWFVVAVATKRNDVADVAWGLGFVIASVAAMMKTGNHSQVAVMTTILVAIWGLRLSAHIGIRNSRKPEDYRYKAWRDSWGKWFVLRSYFQIFVLQGLLMLLILTPVLLVNTYSTDRISPLVVVGALIWAFGFLFESIADKQLKDFVSNPLNKGQVMDKGLWKYTRHPNYFGEITQWWAIGFIALSSRYGLVGVVGPVVITFLIVKVSGIPLLEAKMSANPEYQAYALRTSSLVPLPKRK